MLEPIGPRLAAPNKATRNVPSGLAWVVEKARPSYAWFEGGCNISTGLEAKSGHFPLGHV